jgi:hypothetical protein
MKFHLLSLLAFVGLSGTSWSGPAQRHIQSLDGTWRIADSRSATPMPAAFDRRVTVPGLANLAQPEFKDIDRFTSRENMANKVRSKLVPPEWLTNYWTGKVDQDRNYFWYETTFRAPRRRAVATLKIAKAQFGTAVWLNGQPMGDYAGCFTASYYPLNNAIRWNEENTLVVRIGAHPAVLPDTYPTGSDFEKIKWTPGIYDSVSVIYSDNPVIESVQVAPRVESDEVLVQTRVRNHGATAVAIALAHQVKTWKGGKTIATGAPVPLALQPGEERVVTQTLRIPNARLWSPDDPFLYAMESSTGGDSVTTRFGMREFRFDAKTQRAYLNGNVIYLRGSNITLHRFFEDPLCQDRPWNEPWVRKLLGELPKRMNWNYFRFCIGPVPDRWLDICDEMGLLVQNEFFIWTGAPGWYEGYSRQHDRDELIRQYQDWMRDNWNHPSVVVWDANNETRDEIFAKVIPAVRHLDLSGRPWENSYNPPDHPDDPVEHHPYLMFSGYRGQLTFRMTDLEAMDGKPTKGQLPSDTNPPLINEYGWLWLNRDGSPTVLTENVYATLIGTNATARARLDLYAYLLGAKTEFWRAHRHYAGIIHFVYLTCSYPGVYTADHFADVSKLKLDPAFEDYVGQSFKPIGVYLNFFQPTLSSGQSRSFKVMLVNDLNRAVRGSLRLTLVNAKNKELARAEKQLELDALGDASIQLPLMIPSHASGNAMLRAAFHEDGARPAHATLSRRWVELQTAE